MNRFLYLLFIFLFFGALLGAAPVEVGKVAWQRDLTAALVEAGNSGKPVFLLFQEVPGCAGCQQFGRDVLSDPRLVAVIEREFVPVLVRNNVGGEEAKILKHYDEPAWNYQVVRFLDAKGQDLIPRKDRVWETQALALRMKQALLAAKRPVPSDLRNVIIGTSDASLDEAVFAMSCFWTGEARLGAIDGVVTTEAGFYDGREVTRVQYDASKIALSDLAEQAAQLGCAQRVYVSSESGRTQALRTEEFVATAYRRAPNSDQKRQLSGTPLSQLKLTPEQATKVNAWARRDYAKALEHLSVEQFEQLK